MTISLYHFTKQKYCLHICDLTCEINENGKLVQIKEKPNYSFLANTGYLTKKYLNI